MTIALNVFKTNWDYVRYVIPHINYQLTNKIVLLATFLTVYHAKDQTIAPYATTILFQLKDYAHFA